MFGFLLDTEHLFAIIIYEQMFVVMSDPSVVMNTYKKRKGIIMAKVVKEFVKESIVAPKIGMFEIMLISIALLWVLSL